MEFPKFSVILPTYNRAFIIQSAIDSVLKQFYENFELIIVDDGSTDQTEQLIQKNYKQQLKTGKINYIKCAHLGVCAARNVGLDAAKNDWIAYIDSDNIMFKEALGTFASFIQNNKDTKNFYGSMISMSSKKIYGNFFSYSQLKENNFIDLGTYVHHKSLIKECGKFNLNIKKYVDWDFILRQCYLYTPIFIKTAVLYYNDSLRFKRITTEEKKAENFKQVKLNIEKFEKDIAENKRINDEQQNDTSQQDVSVLSIKSDFPKTANPIRFSFSSDKDTQKKIQNNLTLTHKEVQPQQKIYSQLSKFAYFKIIISNCNSMPYIQKCLDSILTQTFQDFKIIIVDDMSTDGSDKFCEMYSQKYPDKIIYQKLSLKGYTGKARNYGIRYNLNCSYYYFINSDEYLENNTALEKLYNSTCKDSPHMVLFKMTLKSSMGQVIHSETLPSYDKFIKQKNSNILLSFWNSSSSRIVRSDKIQFFLERSIYAEDTYQWMLLVDNCTRIKEIDEDIYVHQQNITDSSINKDKKLEEKSQKIFVDELVKYYHKTANKKLQLDIIGYLQSIKNVLYPYVVNTLQTLEIEKHEKEYKLSKKEKPIPQEKPHTKLSQLDKADVSQKAVDQQTESVFFKIIIPNYNNMPYIQKCLDSILTQSFQDFKVIIVDDLSTDSSDNVCKAYARKFPDKIIFQSARTKGYAGKCRNIGLEYPIKSKYILFLDSDDWFYNTTVLHDLANSIAEHNFPDIIHCNSFFLRQKRQLRIKTYDELCECQFCAAPWQYCIKSSLSTITFKENRPKNNDNVWFLNLANEFESHTVFYYQNPVCVYNNCSSTSCQNSNLMFTKKNIFSSTVLLLNDILPIPAKTILAQKFKQRVVENRPKLLKKLLGNRTMPKQLNIDAVLKNSFATSIDDDRFARLNLVFSAQKLQCPTKMPGIQNADLSPAQNCYQTHVKIVKYAKTHNLPFVMIFEDDAYPCKNCYDEFQDYLNLVPNDAELLIFGWIRHVNIRQSIQTTQKFDRPFNKIQTDTTQIWGAHAYLIFASAYDKYLKYAEDHPKNEQPDGLTYNIFNSYITDKPLFIQYNSSTKSLIHKTNTNYLYYGSHDLPPQNFDIVENYLYTSKMYNEKLGTLEKLTDKIKHIMKFGHLMPNKTLCADKIKVHEYCKTVLGKDICIPIIRIYNSIDEINLSVLPQSFVIKANHGCGYNLIVKNKSVIDENYVKMLASKWINDDFSRYQHEMQYKLIPHKIFAEQFMFDGHTDSLTDYKFLCFNGKPIYCQVINDRHNSKRRLNYYDMDFNFVDICRLEFPNNKQQLDSKPKKWEEMKSIAQKLSSNFDFVRVDLYEINGVVYLGEMTFTPGAGLIRYKNPNDDIRLGKLLKLSKLI